MSQLVSDVVQQVLSPFKFSNVAVYVTAPGMDPQEMLTVPLLQSTDFSISLGEQGAEERETL